MVLINSRYCKTAYLLNTHQEQVPNKLSTKDLLCVRSERTLFKQLSFEVHDGECLHVIGANGSGKSSLLRIVCGILTADQGSIHWNDQPIVSNQRYLSDLAYIGHKDGLKNELTAVENLSFYQVSDSKRDYDQIDDYLQKLGILNCAELLTVKLSFGQRRRLAFARLLIKHYPIWVLDEPFTGIDQNGRHLIENLCLEHLRSGGMIVLTNHQSLQESALSAHLRELTL